MRSQSAVYKGRVYLGTETVSVYALDARTGCTYYWSTSVKNVRSGLSIGKAGETEALFFGDALGIAHALDLQTGRELWQTKVGDSMGRRHHWSTHLQRRTPVRTDVLL